MGLPGDLSGAELLKAIGQGRLWLNLHNVNAYLPDYAGLCEDMFAALKARVPRHNTSSSHRQWQLRECFAVMRISNDTGSCACQRAVCQWCAAPQVWAQSKPCFAWPCCQLRQGCTRAGIQGIQRSQSFRKTPGAFFHCRSECGKCSEGSARRMIA